MVLTIFGIVVVLFNVASAIYCITDIFTKEEIIQPSANDVYDEIIERISVEEMEANKVVLEQTPEKRKADLEKLVYRTFREHSHLFTYLRGTEEDVIDGIIKTYDYLASKYKYIKVVDHPVSEVIFKDRTYFVHGYAHTIKFDEVEKKERAICCICLLNIPTTSGNDFFSYIGIVDLNRKKFLEVE